MTSRVDAGPGLLDAMALPAAARSTMLAACAAGQDLILPDAATVSPKMLAACAVGQEQMLAGLAVGQG